MVLQHVWGLFTNPKREWVAIRDDECTIGKCYAVHVLILAAIPAISGFIGTTQFGWQIGAGDPIKLALDSAAIIAVLYYLAMIVGVYSIGWMIHWMGETYGADAALSQCVVLAAYTATPLFLIGIMELYPVLWLNMVLGIPALAYTVYLLYTGVPIMMGISEERGFLFSSAVLGVGLIAFVALLAITAILWGMGLEPRFTR
jgi:hypothetical protein